MPSHVSCGSDLGDINLFNKDDKRTSNEIREQEKGPNFLDCGTLAAADVKKGEAGYVVMPGTTKPLALGGAAFKNALRNGGKLVDGPALSPTVNGNVAPREKPIHFLP